MTRAWWLFAAGAWAVAGVVPATPAAAATLGVRTGTDVATLVYRAAPGERNHLQIYREYPAGSGTYSVSFSRGAVLGPGCEPEPINPGRGARCTLPPGLRREASIRLGDRADTASLAEASEFTARIAGGPGNDAISGPGSQDEHPLPYWLTLALQPPQPRLQAASSGGSASPGQIWGGRGRDALWGGPGADILDPGPGLDFAAGAAGNDTVVARDGEFDYVQCDAGRDGLRLDRWDVAWSRCGPILRRGAPMAVPLNVILDWEDLQETTIIVGCPSDMPAACRGVLTLSVRGGRAVYRSRFRAPPGRNDTKAAYLDEDDMHALAARRAKLVVRAPDGAGHPRSLARIIRVEGDCGCGD